MLEAHHLNIIVQHTIIYFNYFAYLKMLKLLPLCGYIVKISLK